MYLATIHVSINMSTGNHIRSLVKSLITLKCVHSTNTHTPHWLIDTATYSEHTHCLLRLSSLTVPILRILRNIQMCSYFCILIIVNQLKLINYSIKPPIKTHSKSCFKFLRKRSQKYSLYS